MSKSAKVILRGRVKIKPKEEEIKYGYHSAEAIENGCNEMVYTEPRHGQHVLVTMVTSDPLGRSYKWKDKIFMGPVDKFIRSQKDFDVFLL